MHTNLQTGGMDFIRDRFEAVQAAGKAFFIDLVVAMSFQPQIFGKNNSLKIADLRIFD
ncbi:hypothetical protein SDC9_168954 [bioreactor metagenome]|uniref:Uncharacterized protein n=1 Tax=bioreactor metagenome TaxID=1076179 RepID=A0A645GC13_9ZZZZ